MKRNVLNRRSVLRGAGGLGLALPWLEAMQDSGRNQAHAQGVLPKRLLFFFQSNGYVAEKWTPTGGELDFVLGPSLKPLEPHRKDIVVISGVNQPAAYAGPGDDHMRGNSSLLTNAVLLPGTFRGGCCEPAGLASGISVDQQIVKIKNPPTKFPSLELGVQATVTGGGTAYHYLNYKGSGMALPPTDNPASVFNRIFAGFDGGGASIVDPQALAKLRSRRKSVLDAVARSYEILKPSLGIDDRNKIDAHATTVRELEKRIVGDGNQGKAMASACQKPAAPKSGPGFQEAGKLQMDLMVNAMACDLTRVGTIHWSRAAGQPTYPWLGFNEGAHGLAHESQTAKLAMIDQWYATQFAYLLNALGSVREGPNNQTMLDNTLVMWCNELGNGAAHSHENIPLVLAGRAGGKIKTGRYMKTNKGAHTQLLVSILNAFDVPATSFGTAANGSGPMPGLLTT